MIQAVMKKEINFTAFEYLKSLKRMYSPMKPVILGQEFYAEQDDSLIDLDKAQKLFVLMRYEMLLVREKMSQIYGGSTMLSETLLKNVEQITDYDEFVKNNLILYTKPGKSYEVVDRYANVEALLFNAVSITAL